MLWRRWVAGKLCFYNLCGQVQMALPLQGGRYTHLPAYGQFVQGIASLVMAS